MSIRLQMFIVLMFLTHFIGLRQAYADEVLFLNGDRLTGTIVHADTNIVTLEVKGIGTLNIERGVIEQTVPVQEIEVAEAVEEEEPVVWSGKISGSLNRRRGNTKTTNTAGGFTIKRKQEKVTEFNISGKAEYGASDREMNAQRYSGMTRLAFSFGKSKKWYNFYKLEADHDRFANIEGRYTPSVGIGYWYSDAEDWTLMGELAAGVTFTGFRDDTQDESELVVIPRVYAEKVLIGKSRISQEVVAYPAITDSGEYRLRLDTTFKNPITDRLDIKFSWLNDYNSKPGKDVKEHDMRFISGLEYTF